MSGSWRVDHYRAGWELRIRYLLTQEGCRERLERELMKDYPFFYDLIFEAGFLTEYTPNVAGILKGVIPALVFILPRKLRLEGKADPAALSPVLTEMIAWRVNAQKVGCFFDRLGGSNDQLRGLIQAIQLDLLPEIQNDDFYTRLADFYNRSFSPEESAEVVAGIKGLIALDFLWGCAFAIAVCLESYDLGWLERLMSDAG